MCKDSVYTVWTVGCAILYYISLTCLEYVIVPEDYNEIMSRFGSLPLNQLMRCCRSQTKSVNLKQWWTSTRSTRSREKKPRIPMMLRDFRALSWVKKLGMDSKAATSDLQVNLVEETTPLSDSYVRNQPTLKTF